MIIVRAVYFTDWIRTEIRIELHFIALLFIRLLVPRWRQLALISLNIDLNNIGFITRLTATTEIIKPINKFLNSYSAGRDSTKATPPKVRIFCH